MPQGPNEGEWHRGRECGKLREPRPFGLVAFWRCALDACGRISSTKADLCYPERWAERGC